jgi:hypothetical protein
MSENAVLPASQGWENELTTERAKTTVRWFAIPLLFAVAVWMRRTDPAIKATLTDSVLYIAAGVAVLMTAVESAIFWQPGRTRIPDAAKYLTVTGDMAIISALIYYTGWAQSPFFFVYFVFLISNCLRYGLLMSVFVAAVFNVMYVGTLGLAPPGEVKPSVLGGEGLKILSFWGVALYGGAISARLRRQANQLRVYEETILELRAKLREQEAKPTS